MSTGKRGRPAKNDLDGKVFTLDPLDITINLKAGSVRRDPTGDIILWEGSGTYVNPWSGEEEKMPPGMRGPNFRLLFEVDGETKELRANVTRHVERAEMRQNKK